MKKRKRNFLQKMLAVLLSAVLTAGMITTTMPAEVNAAARVSRASLPAAKEGHTHKVCVGSACTDDSHSDITFDAWTNPVSLPDAGNYYLDTDVTLTYAWYPADGTNLCLNGHTVTQTAGGNSVIEIGKGVTFSLCDCNPACGKLTGGKKSGVYNNGGTFYMYGGEINGNSYSNGGGVYNSSVFSLYGGKINNNTANVYYGGGGVYNASNCTFTMYGGEISNNKVGLDSSDSHGGGVATNGTFAMYGGSITNNKAAGIGGGVLFINGTMKIGGTAVIKDNLCNDKQNNIELDFSTLKLTIDADTPLTKGAYIGVTPYNKESAFTGINDADYSPYFHSDDSAYIVINSKENELMLQKHKHTLTKSEEVPADCSNSGKKAFWECEGCGRIFADAEGTTEILDENDLIIPKREHSFVWKHDEENHWKECEYEDCGMKEGDSSPHEYDNSGDMTCDCGYNRSALDKSAPTGTITIGKDTWNSLLNTVNFNLFLKEAVPVTITAQDTAGTVNSGIDKVSYHLSDKVLTEAEVKALNVSDWTETGALSFSADSAGKCVIYVKITDKAGNAAYLSSDGLVFDKSAPVINGVTDGETYHSPQEVTVTDENLESVKVNGRETVLENGKLSLTADGEYTITAMDKAGNTASLTVTIAIKTHTHDYGTEWKSDKTSHWHECGCGEKKDSAAHTEDKGSVTKAPTETKTGIKTFKCVICGYVMRTEIIPAAGGSQGESEKGDIRTDVEKGENTPDTSISTPVKELADIVLSEAEKQQIENGTTIKIVLDVKDAQDSISGQDKAAVESALNGFTAGQYLDIGLYKIIGEKRSAVSETNKKITITITVPDSLKNADSSITRTFAVIRVHNNQAEILNDLDDNPDTITIETDRFSAYSIIYKDAAKPGTSDTNGSQDGNGNNNNSNSNNSGANTAKQASVPKTGDSSYLELYATLAMIGGLAYLLLYFADGRRGMTEETKNTLVSKITGWAKRGGKIRKLLALAALFVLLAYYHSIGKKTVVKLDEIYEK